MFSDFPNFINVKSVSFVEICSMSVMFFHSTHFHRFQSKLVKVARTVLITSPALDVTAISVNDFERIAILCKTVHGNSPCVYTTVRD